MTFNVYLYDSFFVVGLLIMKRVALAMLDDDHNRFRNLLMNSYHYAEFAYIMLGVIYLPRHQPYEALTAFCGAFIIKFCFNLCPGIDDFFNRIFKTRPNKK